MSAARKRARVPSPRPAVRPVREYPPPRFATARSARRSFGAAVRRVAGALEVPPQLWQGSVYDVGLEVGDDGSWAYSDVVVSVPRQAGKSTLLGPVNVHRCLLKGDARCWVTAQTRQVASDLVVTELGSRAARSPAMRGRARVRRAIGSEGLVFGNGSTLRPFPPSEDGLHGQRADLVNVDEVWAFDEAQGVALEQAVRPTLTTTGGQVWWTSTAGTPASVLLRRLVDRGRSGDPSVAFFEWSTPDDVTADIDRLLRDGADEAISQAVSLTLEHHPGELVRRGPIEAAARSMSPGEFLRAYCNRWTEAGEALVPPHRWEACRWSGSWPAPVPGQLALGIDTTVDRASTVVAAAWRHGGWLLVDVWDVLPGMASPVERVAELAQRWSPRAVAADAGGPAAALFDDYRRRFKVSDRRAMALGAAQWAHGCGQLLQGVVSGEVRHPSHPELDAAAARADARPLGDRFVWDRRAGNVAALGAITAAAYALDHAKVQAKPGVVTMVGG